MLSLKKKHRARNTFQGIMAVVASIWLWGGRDGEEKKEIYKAEIREAAVQSLCRTPHGSHFCHIAAKRYKIIVREEVVVLGMCWTANRSNLSLNTDESYKILVREEAIIVALCWEAHRCLSVPSCCGIQSLILGQQVSTKVSLSTDLSKGEVYYFETVLKYVRLYYYPASFVWILVL